MSYRANDLTSKLSPPEPPEVAKLGAWGLMTKIPDSRYQTERESFRLDSGFWIRLLVRAHTAFSAKSIMSVVLQKDVSHWDVRFFSQEELCRLPRCYVSALILMAQLEQTPVNSIRSIPCLTTRRE